MRLLYMISDGLVTYVISKFFDLNSNMPSTFKSGFLCQNVLSREEVEILTNNILEMKIHSKDLMGEKLKFSGNQLDYEYYKSKKIMRIDFDTSALLSNIEIAKFAIKKIWQDECTKILGTRAFLVGINSWLTLPPPVEIGDYDDVGKIVSSQMWHRDCDNLRDLKVMTYLTDVNDGKEGPFEIIKDTHCFNFFNPFQYVMGPGMRIKNSNVEKKYLNKKHSFLGRAGTSFVVDTRCLHRGKTIVKKKHFRLMLQLYFSNSLFGKCQNNPKISRSWESYNIWKDAINNDEAYKSLFNQSV